jgi:phage/plasmid-like protein (TIGR03299 family)
MPGYFENGVFTDNLPAWHRAGIVVDDEALTKERVFELVPELASEVVQVPLYGMLEHQGEMFVIEAGSHFANVRTLDHKNLGVVGDRYVLVQNDPLFSLAEDIVDQGGAIWKTAGTIKGGSLVWGLLQLPDEIEIGGVSSERMTPYLMVTNSFDGSTGVQIVICWTRVVCWNTWQIAMNEAPRRFSLRHTESVNGRLLEAKEALGIAYKQGEVLQKVGDELIRMPYSQKELDRFLRELVPMPPEALDKTAVRDRVRETREAISTLYAASPNLQGDAAGTRWAALQAVIEFEQHYLYASRKADAQLKATTLDNPRYAGKALALLTD